MKGSVKTARVVRWFTSFFVIAFVCMLFLIPAVIPIQLLITQIKLNPAGMLGSYAFSLLFMGVLIWVYLQLSSPDSLAKLRQAGYRTGKPKTALFAALGIIAVGGILSTLIFTSDSATKARELARAQLGPNYQYHINSLNFSGNNGSAVVTAYNKNEIKYVRVKW